VGKGEGVGQGEGVGWGQQLVGNGAVDSQHGTRVEGSLHICTEGSKECLYLETATVNNCTLYIYCMIVQYCIYFSLVQVKNISHEEVTKPTFILGPVSMVVKTYSTLHVHTPRSSWLKGYVDSYGASV
jgi:hypothetical protein